jgi:hypothetical protein
MVLSCRGTEEPCRHPGAQPQRLRVDSQGEGREHGGGNLVVVGLGFSGRRRRGAAVVGVVGVVEGGPFPKT